MPQDGTIHVMWMNLSFRRNKSLIRALAIGIFLRALIAPGFMLDVGGSGPFGLQIVLCDGPGGNAGLTIDNHQSHHQSGHAADRTDPDQNSDDHLSATCGMWMSSSTFVSQAPVSFDAVPQPDQDFDVRNYSPPYISRRIPGEQQPRAPPESLSA